MLLVSSLTSASVQDSPQQMKLSFAAGVEISVLVQCKRELFMRIPLISPISMFTSTENSLYVPRAPFVFSSAG